MKEQLNLKCSFCCKSQYEVRQVLAGNNNCSICNECIALCRKALSEVDDTRTMAINLIPHEIYSLLNKYIIGQNKAKKVLAVTLYNHYKKFSFNYRDNIKISKSNILMIGPTGCGKTLLAQTLAKIFDVPIAIADATNLTEAGYVGEDVENILVRLVQAANGDIGIAEKGIVYLDEIDKISKKSENLSITRDVSGEGVQQALLKIIEGTIASIPQQGARKHPQQELVSINTEDILFICSGSFTGLQRIITERKKKYRIGFIQNASVDTSDFLSEVESKDLVKYGLIPEFIGRLPQVVIIQELSESKLVRILTEPRNSLVKQYKKLFSFYQITLEFTKSGIQEIARLAIARDTGARGLKSIIENILLDTMFDLPSRQGVKKIIIDSRSVKYKILPQYIEV